MKNAGYGLEELRAGGAPWSIVGAAGFSVQDIIAVARKEKVSTGMDHAKTKGYGWTAAFDAGFSDTDVAAAGVASLEELREYQQMLEALLE